MWKWGGITFAIGVALVVIDLLMASKKKGGISPTDMKRIAGLFWLTLIVSGLVMGLIWVS